MGKRFKVIRDQPRAASRPVNESVPGVRFTWKFYLIAAALVCATFAVYWQTTHFPLLDVDDPDYVTLNTNVRAGLTAQTIHWAFNLGYAANWHPLTWMSHMFDCEFFGMTPGVIHGTGGHHLVNLLLHAASTVLLFALLYKVTTRLWPSAFVAALFAVHPLHVESVAWVAERKDALSTFFLMLTFCAYVAYARGEGIGRKIVFFGLTVLAYACGLMSKQMLVSAPILMLLFDYWPLNRLFLNQNPNLSFNFRAAPRLIGEKISFVLMAIAASVAVVMAQGSGGAISQRILLQNRIANAIVTYVIYLADMFWPHNLAHYYPHEAYNWQTFDILGALVILGGITVAALWLRKTRPYLLVGWLWYLVTLIPVIGIVQVGGQARADRYTYIPSIGIFIMVAFGVADLLKEFFSKRELLLASRTFVHAGVAAIGLLVTTSLAVAAHTQVGYWRSGEILCKHTLSVTRNNWFVHSALAAILNTQASALRAAGKNDEAIKKNEEAIDHLKSTLTIMPCMANAHIILANAYLELNKLDDAVKEFQIALTLEPNNALGHSNLANTLKKQGKMDAALSEYQAALRCDPTRADSRYNYALALQQSGRSDEALKEFETALKNFPDDLAGYWIQEQMADILVRQGRKDEALNYLRNAVAINERSHVDPNNAASGMLHRLEGH
jgi:protein O-mannosyl-transferase